MRLGEGTPCKVIGGEHTGKRGIVIEGRQTIRTSLVKIDGVVQEIEEQYIEYAPPEHAQPPEDSL